ncbi:dual specificity protein kinase pyk3-like isoform X5 [Drosophila sulfurigaster albostrigata]|uniref:dual specificity protein kinase pyk3-like isoform X5 n=1 Tax=Drosophila sulfurigaster albostrigata TaxID=89887 RepID=UPI002D21906A|nr:dual specificity protein kinase pyk3-like isoform X5 [Drosophila sulfurigaster albostrigata]
MAILNTSFCVFRFAGKNCSDSTIPFYNRLMVKKSKVMTRNIDWNELIVDNKCIGSGTFGDVYKATWNSNNGPITVVIKQFYRNSTDDKNKKEVDMLSLVNHDNIVKLIGTTKDEKERTAIVMEYAECGSLHSLLHNEENKNIILPHSLRISWMLQCAEAIKYLHELSPTILHRDLKPRNLLLFNNYRTLKICDFGSVKELETIMSYAGTVCYMAPEVASTKSYTEKCDVYSFGITFWEVMSRKKPFYHLGVCEEVAILFSAATKGARPHLDDIRNIPEYEQIIELIVLCWNGDAEKRPTMQEIISNISNLYPIMDVEEPNLSLKIPVKNEVNRLIDEDMNAIQKNEWTNITLEKLISYGAFGDVYKALWKTEKGPKIIAVKRYRPHYSIKEQLIKIHSLQLKHEHIQKLYCLSFDHNKRPIELMEYPDCGTLYSAVHDRTVNICNNAYEMFSLMWMLHCAKGLKFLHEQKIVHREITTRNLFLFNNYQTLKISLSEAVMTEGASIMLGNFIYMAPEIMGGMQYTKKCDIYRFGIMLWEVMSRKKPFNDKESLPLLFGIIKGLRPNVNDVVDIHNSDDIKILITKCWDANPRNRPSIKEVLAIMEKYSFY